MRPREKPPRPPVFVHNWHVQLAHATIVHRVAARLILNASAGQWQLLTIPILPRSIYLLAISKHARAATWSCPGLHRTMDKNRSRYWTAAATHSWERWNIFDSCVRKDPRTKWTIIFTYYRIVQSKCQQCGYVRNYRVAKGGNWEIVRLEISCLPPAYWRQIYAINERPHASKPVNDLLPVLHFDIIPLNAPDVVWMCVKSSFCLACQVLTEYWQNKTTVQCYGFRGSPADNSRRYCHYYARKTRWGGQEEKGGLLPPLFRDKVVRPRYCHGRHSAAPVSPRCGRNTMMGILLARTAARNLNRSVAWTVACNNQARMFNILRNGLDSSFRIHSAATDRPNPVSKVHCQNCNPRAKCSTFNSSESDCQLNFGQTHLL